MFVCVRVYHLLPKGRKVSNEKYAFCKIHFDT